MKRLILIGGAMGVGKTTTARGSEPMEKRELTCSVCCHSSGEQSRCLSFRVRL